MTCLAFFFFTFPDGRLVPRWSWALVSLWIVNFVLLIVAALFQPLRHHFQFLVDRRFYRRKYDAQKTLATFSTTLRGEVHLEQSGEQLLAVVQETMQPAHLSLWIRPLKQQTSGERPGVARARELGLL